MHSKEQENTEQPEPIAHEALWESQFANLLIFQKNNPGKYPNSTSSDKTERTLSVWCSKQRKRYINGTLKPHRLARLKEIKFEFSTPSRSTNAKEYLTKQEWAVADTKWMERLQQLMNFRKKNPDKWPNQLSKDLKERSLHKWGKNQRILYAKGTLNRYRLEKLLAIGFNIKPLNDDEIWLRHFNELKTYLQEHEGFPGYKHKLHTWISTQSIKYADLSAKRRKLLDSIHFQKNRKIKIKYEKNWMRRFAEVVEYYKKNDHLPSRRENRTLHIWLAVQRRHLKENRMPAEKKKRFKEGGIDILQGTFSKTSWQERFNDLKSFIKKNKRFPSQSKPAESSLYAWFTKQKSKYTGKLAEGSELTSEQVTQLKKVSALS